MAIKLNAETLIRHVLEDEIKAPGTDAEKVERMTGRLVGRISKPIVIRGGVKTIEQGEPS